MNPNSTASLLQETFRVLLVGNNPIDLSRALEKINKVQGRKIITEIAFDVKSLAERLLKFRPNYILIDDNIGRSELSLTVETLTRSAKTKDVPITIIKNSNYAESIVSSNVIDFILKTHFSPEALYNAFRNSIKFRKTQVILRNAYRTQTKKLRLKF